MKHKTALKNPMVREVLSHLKDDEKTFRKEIADDKKLKQSLLKKEKNGKR